MSKGTSTRTESWCDLQLQKGVNTISLQVDYGVFSWLLIETNKFSFLLTRKDGSPRINVHCAVIAHTLCQDRYKLNHLIMLFPVSE